MENSEFKKILRGIEDWEDSSWAEVLKLHGYACCKMDMDVSQPVDLDTVADLIFDDGYLLNLRGSISIIINSFPADKRPFIMDTEADYEDASEVFYTDDEFRKSYESLKASGDTEAETYDDYVANCTLGAGGIMIVF